MTWIIVRTDHRKEYYVAGRIRAALGLEAWVPSQFVARRPAIARRRLSVNTLPQITEAPIVPKLLFAAVPDWALYQAELDGIRHMKGIEQDAEQRAARIPDAQIKVFRDAVARENAAAMALAAARSKKRDKEVWRPLKDALLALVDSARQQMEEAA